MIVLLKLPLKLLVSLLGMIILPFVLPFVSRDKEELPRLFRIFDNHELHLKNTNDPDGLLGPEYYRAAVGTLDKSRLSFTKLLWERYNWLALRNPANYFQYKYLGFQVSEDCKVVKTNGNIYIGDHVWNDRGLYTITVENKGKRYSEWYLVYPYPFTDGEYGIRIRIGYKIGNPSKLVPGKWVQHVCSITPVKYLL